MKKLPKKDDPLGVRPVPLTGDLVPRFLDVRLKEKAGEALAGAKSVWVEHEPQEIVIAQIRVYLDGWALAHDKSACGGLRLSQYSQAGKTATMRRLKRVLAEERQARGLPSNQHQVVIVTLRKRTTLKQLYRHLLKELGDPHWDQEPVSPETLLVRLTEHSARVGLEVLVIDEIQHVDNETKDAKDVLDQLKVFVDEGVFPIVFVGDEDSEALFERNGKFAARLGGPLELPPLEPAREEREADAVRFCIEFDKALSAAGLISRRAGLEEPALLDGLVLASGGHVGRVARLLQIAVPHSVWRGAATVDAYDLSHAIRSYGIKNGWVKHDPYSRAG